MGNSSQKQLNSIDFQVEHVPNEQRFCEHKSHTEEATAMRYHIISFNYTIEQTVQSIHNLYEFLDLQFN